LKTVLPGPFDGPHVSFSFDAERLRDSYKLAEGGQGVVWVTKDTAFNRQVARKELKRSVADDESAKARFLSEAQITGRLEHPGIVPIYDLGRESDGRPYYLMRLVGGNTLEKAIRTFHDKDVAQRREWEGRTKEFRALLDHFCFVCTAVHFAHDQDVVHRDLKPANVVLGTHGECYVLDWGLAKKLAGNEDPCLSPGQPIGTPVYMSPEAADPKRHAEVGKASDVYSLGAILYQLITGCPPFCPHKERNTVLAEVRSGRFPPPRKVNPSVPMPLEKVCLKAMEKEPGDRYSSAQHLADDVKKWLGDESVSCYSDPLLQRLARWVRWNIGKTVGMVTFSFCLIVLFIGIGVKWYRDEQAARRERDQTRRETEQLARAADDLFAKGNYEEAQARAVEGVTRLQGRTEFEGLRELLERTRETAGAKLRLKQFKNVSAQAEYHLLGRLSLFLLPQQPESGRGFTRLYDRGPDLRLGLDKANDALEPYGLPEDLTVLRETPIRWLNEAETRELRERAAEVLLLRGLGLEERDRDLRGEEIQETLREAVRLFDQAERLGSDSRFLYQQRARLRARLGQEEAAKADLAKAENAGSNTFLDLRLQAADLSRSHKWDQAAAAYREAFRLRPDEYWTGFRLAFALQHLGEWKEALGVLQSCKSLRKDDPVAPNEAGCILNSLKDWKQAATEFEEAIQKDPKYLIAYGNLIRALGEMGQLSQAEKVLRDFIARGSPKPVQNAFVHNNMSMAFDRARLGIGPLTACGVALKAENLRRAKMALYHVNKALELDPEHVGAWRNRSIYYRERRRYPEAERDALRTVELDPGDAELWFVLGYLFHDQNRLLEALLAYSRALALDPGMVNAYVRRCEVFVRLGQLNMAVRDQSKVIVLEPGSRAYYDRAILYAQMRNYKAAIEDLTLLLARFRGEPDVKWVKMRGEMWGRMGNFTESEVDLTYALQLDPKDPVTWRNRAVTRMKAKKWQEAIADYQECLGRARNKSEAAGFLNDVGSAFLEMDRDEEALSPLNNAIVLKDHAEARINRGRVFLNRGDLPNAIKDYDKAIQLDERLAPRARGFRGLAHLRRGSPDKAEEDLNGGPQNSQTFVFRALAKQARGKTEAAKADWLRVAKIRPVRPQVHFAKGMIYLLGNRFPEAIHELTPAMEEPLQRPFALAQRARAWLGVGAKGIPRALADADLLVKGCPKEGGAHLEAARLYALAAEQVNPKDQARLLDRSLDLLEQAAQVEPGLRKEFATDRELRLLRDQPRFKKLSEGQ
jgi:tetratricopeptide (TPR) repeat protein/tRNA A-37 threonylcarbamoyl transferase component Bud32